jgi:lipoprotein-anchoring transpeptidase ErfK/SrfK
MQTYMLLSRLGGVSLAGLQFSRQPSQIKKDEPVELSVVPSYGAELGHSRSWSPGSIQTAAALDRGNNHCSADPRSKGVRAANNLHFTTFNSLAARDNRAATPLHAQRSSAMTLFRALLVFFCGPLAACNTAMVAPRHIADLGSVVASYAYLNPDSPVPPALEPAVRGPKLSRHIIAFLGEQPPGTVVIRTSERRLYLVLDDGKAISYPVGVGRAGKQWQGRAEIDGAYVEPGWSPTPEIKRDNPNLPDLIAGGAPENPMGARALTLSGGEYAIHGTNRPESIGTYASYGCIRMFNEDVIELFGRVKVGTEVIVTI